MKGKSVSSSLSLSLSIVDVVLGATSVIGNLVVERLKEAGRTVKAASRSGKPPWSVSEQVAGSGAVEYVTADASNPEVMKKLLKGVERVFVCISFDYTKWLELFPPALDGILAGCRETGTALIWFDNMYCYGPQPGGTPLRTDLPLTSYGRKPAMRAQLVHKLTEFSAGGHPMAIIRASDFYGPGVKVSMLGERAIVPLLNGKAAEVLGDPDAPHSWAYAPDIARAIVSVADDRTAYGKAWHVPNAEPKSQREMVELFAKTAGVTEQISVVSACLISTLACFGVKIMCELKEMAFIRDRPYIVDHSEFATRFWEDVTPLNVGAAATIRWYKNEAIANRERE